MPQSIGGTAPRHVVGLPPVAPPLAASTSHPGSPSDGDEPKRKRFHPFKAMRRMFSRKKYSRTDSASDENVSRKSRSTSELQNVTNDDCKIVNSDGTGPYSTRLSLSHDSIFTSELSAHEPELIHGSSLSIQDIAMQKFKDELIHRIHSQRDSDDDMGLPHSPSAFPNTAEIIEQGLKQVRSSKSRSTWSNGSLISMASSENDEDSMFSHMSSHHSSHASLLERRAFTPDGDIDVLVPIPLNHEAARHKISIRPKKTRAAAKHLKVQNLSIGSSNLPSTPEVEEGCQTSSPSTSKQSHSINKSGTTVSEHRKSISSESSVQISSSNEFRSNTNIHSAVTTIDTSFTASQSKTKIVGGPKSPRSLSLRRENSFDQQKVSPPVSRSKSNGAELKLQHEISKYAKRMADMSIDETREAKSSRKEAKTFKSSEEVVTCSTEEVLKASWLDKLQPKSHCDDDKFRPNFESDESKVVMSGVKKRDAASSSPNHESKSSEEPFLSRLFGSKKNAKKLKKNDDVKLEKHSNVHHSNPAQKKDEINSTCPEFELTQYDQEPPSNFILKSKSNEDQSRSSVSSDRLPIKLKPIVNDEAKDSKTGDDSQVNEFMLKFRKISENSEKRLSIGSRMSGELVYQSNPTKGVSSDSQPAKSLLSDSFNTDSDSSGQTDIGESELRSVQFRILPGEDKSPRSSLSSQSDSQSDCSLSKFGDIRKSFGLKKSSVKDKEVKSPQIKGKQKNFSSKNDFEVKEIVDDNANITKISITKRGDADVKTIKTPLRETQSEVTEKSNAASKSLQLKTGKHSTKENKPEKSKTKTGTPESELLKVFAKLSQKNDEDSLNDKENVSEDNSYIQAQPEAFSSLSSCSSGRSLQRENSLIVESSSDHETPRSRSRTLPEIIIPHQNLKKNGTKAKEAVKRSNSDKKVNLTKQNSISKQSNPECAPSWLTIAQQRREQREKREKTAFGDQSVSFIIESTSAKLNQRSSKVMDMVSNFQKLQVS